MQCVDGCDIRCMKVQNININTSRPSVLFYGSQNMVTLLKLTFMFNYETAKTSTKQTNVLSANNTAMS